MSMYCFQCEQTFRTTGCVDKGVCGKDADTAALQDLLIQASKEISVLAHEARKSGYKNHDIDVFTLEALFTTVTNVNFDKSSIADFIFKAADYKRILKSKLAASDNNPGLDLAKVSDWETEKDLDKLIVLGNRISIGQRLNTQGQDIAGLQELVMYGLKGMAAYADHALVLDVEDDEVYAFFHEALAFLANNPGDADALVGMSMRVGEVNLKVMEMLDRANTGAYGNPEPTKLRVTPVTGKCILVSGHDLKDIKALLEQTEGKGINIYTHGEMLPSHGYPELKKHKHLVGNYGGAWQDQRKEFDDFPGAILMTTNCIQEPRDTYKDNIFTCGMVQWPEVKHIDDQDFSEVIEKALELPGFREDAEEAYTMTGFGHNAVLGVADKVIEGVKSGKIKHFFLVGGCDGAKSSRNYYNEFAEKTPDDTILMTLACGKFRFNKMEFGDIDGIPRMLDIGQCNDAYSAIKIASALADAFEVGVNDLPLSIVLSWYEQKAVCILLTLLFLGIKNMRIGPTLPAFIGPEVLNILVDKFNLMPIETADKDLEAILG